MSVVPSVEQLSAVADELRGLVGGLDPELVTTREAPDLCESLEEIRRLAGGAQMLLAKRVDESDAAAKAGLRNGAEWIAHRSGGSLRSAYEAVAASQRLVAMPEVTAALRQGRVSTIQATVIADACAADPTAAVGLLGLADRASLGELRRECLRVKAAADPDPKKTRKRIRRERSLRWFLDQEGAWNLHGRGPAEAGAELATVLAPIIDDIFAAAREAGVREPREAYTWDGLLEMARMAWAFMHGQSLDDVQAADTGETVGTPTATGSAAPAEAEAASRRDNEQDDGRLAAAARPFGDDVEGDEGQTAAPAAGSSGDGDEGDDSQLAAVVAGSFDDGDRAGLSAGVDDVVPDDRPVRVRAPRKRRRRTAGVKPWARVIVRIDHSALVRGHVEGDEVCDVAGLGPISVSAARELLGQANVDLLVTKGRDVATYTYLGRGPSVAQRIAATWNQPECQRLGCHRPVSEWDHREPWAHNPVTEVGNMEGLCKPDHDLKSREDWELVDGVGKRPMVPPDDPRHPKNRGRRPRDKPHRDPVAA